MQFRLGVLVGPNPGPAMPVLSHPGPREHFCQSSNCSELTGKNLLTRTSHVGMDHKISDAGCLCWVNSREEKGNFKPSGQAMGELTNICLVVN